MIPASYGINVGRNKSDDVKHASGTYYKIGNTQTEITCSNFCPRKIKSSAAAACLYSFKN